MRRPSFWIVCAALMIIGCMNSLPPLPPRPVPSGFLSNYSHLAPSRNPETPAAWVYLNQQKNLGLYKILMLDPVAVKLRPDSGAENLPAEDLRKLAAVMDQELRSTLEPTYPIVTTPAFGVARVRVALTDAAPNFPNLQGVNSRPLTGAMAVEVELLDSLSGEQLAAAVDTRSGRMNFSGNTFEDYGYARDAMHQWAFLLLDVLNQSKGLHRGSEMKVTGNIWR